MRRTAPEAPRNLDGRVGKTCVVEEMYREGGWRCQGESVLVCNGVRMGISFDTDGHSTVVGDDRHLQKILDSLKKEYREPNIKEFIASAVGIAGEEGMTLDACIKQKKLMS
jgi:hypothetical protein